MLVFVLKKLYVTALTLLGVSVIAFFLMRAVPGDFIDSQLGQFYTEQRAAELREQYGLGRPVVVQYGQWLAGVFRGDLGESTYARQPVTTTVIQHLPITPQLASMAMLFALVTGIPLGIFAAIRQGKWLDYACSSLGVLGVSVPNFWLATLLILVFSYHLGWLPSGGVYVSPGEDLAQNLRIMLLPTIALGTAVAAVIMRMTRSSMLEVIGQDYVRTARAKGLAPQVVIVRHALRNAMIPILTITAIQAGYLLGGSIVIEFVFNLPGIGMLVYRSAEDRDYFLLQAVILLIATSFIVINLAVDLVYGLLDPRLRK